jgi:hypothetical protein
MVTSKVRVTSSLEIGARTGIESFDDARTYKQRGIEGIGITFNSEDYTSQQLRSYSQGLFTERFEETRRTTQMARGYAVTIL